MLLLIRTSFEAFFGVLVTLFGVLAAVFGVSGRRFGGRVRRQVGEGVKGQQPPRRYMQPAREVDLREGGNKPISDLQLYHRMVAVSKLSLGAESSAFVSPKV